MDMAHRDEGEAPPSCSFAANDAATDILDREIRNVSFAVEKCRGARTATYEQIEQKSTEYNVKVRKEAKKIVRLGRCKFLKVLNYYRKHRYPTSQHRSNKQRMWLSGKVQLSHATPAGAECSLHTLGSLASAASKEEGYDGVRFE
jgi:hypothetical protein